MKWMGEYVHRIVRIASIGIVGRKRVAVVVSCKRGGRIHSREHGIGVSGRMCQWVRL